MNNIKKLLIFAIALFVVGAVGCLFTFQQANQSEKVSKEKVITEGFTSMELESGNSHINVQPTKETKAKIEISGQKAKNTNLIFDTNIENNTLKVKVREKHLNFFVFNFFSHSLTVDVYLPENQYKELTIDNNNGRVNMENLTATKLKAKTNNGRVALKNIISNKVNAETDNGRVSLYHVTGDIVGKTNNGKISIETKDMDRNMDLHCDNGRITVKTEKEPTNAMFNVHVDNGRVNILDKYNGNAIIGQGKYKIKLSTDNGSINITK